MATGAEFHDALRSQLEQIKSSGLYKEERTITSRQDSRILTSENGEVVNLCSNNYLGLSSHPDVVAAAHAMLDDRGYGLSSVRFICGTQDIHRRLEERISRFLGTEDTILYSSAFDANAGLFECLLGPEDAIISDELNHASIIDGIRLCKAKRYRYRNDDLSDLRHQLRAAIEAGARYMLVFTDGVFSMDGTIARLDEMRAVCDEFGALLGVDDSHATGFLGKTGRGTHEHRGVFGKIDIITGTLGKALGGASGGFASAASDVVAILRQRSRPYLFSNTLSPVIVGATLKVLDLLEADTCMRDNLEENARYFRTGLTTLGFELKPGAHPIIPVMLYNANLAQEFAIRLLAHRIYVTGFFYPVVPQEQARIRVQVSAQHSRRDLDAALDAFGQIGRDLGVVA